MTGVHVVARTLLAAILCASGPVAANEAGSRTWEMRNVKPGAAPAPFTDGRRQAVVIYYSAPLSLSVSYNTPLPTSGNSSFWSPTSANGSFWSPAGSYSAPWPSTGSYLPRLTLPPLGYYRTPAPTPTGTYYNPAARYAPRAHADEAAAPPDAPGNGPVQEVLARGSAPLGEGGRAAARAAAIQQALRNALEQVVGVYVAGATVADKFLTLKDRVYTHSEGFVVPGEVVEETDDGTTLTVRMKVIVSLRPLLNRLKELGLTRNWKVAVAIREGAGTTAAGAAPIAETAIVQRLIRAGFQVVYLTGGDADDVETFLHSLRGERGAPAADVLILGTAAARLSERLPVTVGSRVVSSMAVYQGRVEARAIRVETGEVIASHLMDEMASSSNDSVAAGSALRGAARGAAGAFLDDILALPAGFTRRVQLEVYGFKKRSDAQALEDALPLLAGVRRVEYRNYADGQLVLELEIDSETAERLGSDLENARALKGLKLVVETDTKARIRARVTGT